VSIKAVIFDFGGTLDTNGIHWGEKFYEAYGQFNLEIPREDFREAFVWASRNVPGLIKRDHLLSVNLFSQLALQRKFLLSRYPALLKDDNLVIDMTNWCYSEVLENIKISEPVLKELRQDYKLGLVSNYFGNMINVLTELSLSGYFDSIIDSTIVEIRKPDPRIFEFALNELKLKPEETVVVGDSYKNDIAPAKVLGCRTIWIKVKGWEVSNDTDTADSIITSINDLPREISELK
jgi:HAD superfamily hydrolase (TIGR01509 family)